jgi:hypothetical protein
MIEDSDDEQEVPEEKVRIHYSLSFKYTFEYDDDVVFFSHFYPYSQHDLENTLDTLSNEPSDPLQPGGPTNSQSIMRVDNLCSTLGGNPCYVVTITQNINTYLSSEDEQ